MKIALVIMTGGILLGGIASYFFADWWIFVGIGVGIPSGLIRLYYAEGNPNPSVRGEQDK